MTWQSSLDSVPEQPSDPGTFRALANYQHDKEKRDALPEWQRGYPASHWTKRRIIEYSRMAGVPQSSIDVLERMSREDVLTTFLVSDGVHMTGKLNDFYRMKRTQFWRLDFDLIKEFGGECE